MKLNVLVSWDILELILDIMDGGVETDTDLI